MMAAGPDPTLNQRLSYAAPAFALAVVGLPVYVYMPKFYTDVVGVDIAVMGTLLFGLRIFDAVTDPLIGFISDRTKTSWGRRRPFILWGGVVVAAGLVLLFNPPVMSSGQAVAWFAVTSYALFLFWTVVAVPYESLGPEIVFDYDRRTSLFALRDGALIAGTLLAAASPAIVGQVMDLPENAFGERLKFYWISVGYAPLVVGACFWCVAAIREHAGERPADDRRWFAGLSGIRANRPFWILMAAYTISAIGNNLPATLILFYVQYVLQSQNAEIFLLLYFVTGVALLPAWIKLARRSSKKTAWLLAMGINSGAFAFVFFLGPGDVLAYGVLVVISGIGFGATLALPSAIQADVIDYDELLTGQRREGQYIGLWAVAKKLSAALGIGAGLLLLGLAGYQPNQPQTEQVQLMLRVLYALVPAVCNLLGLILAWAYPISRPRHRVIRAAIDGGEAGAPSCDPIRTDCWQTYPLVR